MVNIKCYKKNLDYLRNKVQEELIENRKILKRLQGNINDLVLLKDFLKKSDKVIEKELKFQKIKEILDVQINQFKREERHNK